MAEDTNPFAAPAADETIQRPAAAGDEWRRSRLLALLHRRAVGCLAATAVAAGVALPWAASGRALSQETHAWEWVLALNVGGVLTALTASLAGQLTTTLLPGTRGRVAGVFVAASSLIPAQGSVLLAAAALTAAARLRERGYDCGWTGVSQNVFLRQRLAGSGAGEDA